MFLRRVSICCSSDCVGVVPLDSRFKSDFKRPVITVALLAVVVITKPVVVVV